MTKVQSDSKTQTSDPQKVRDLREANENVRKARDEDATDAAVDPKKTGNKPALDRDR